MKKSINSRPGSVGIGRPAGFLALIGFLLLTWAPAAQAPPGPLGWLETLIGRERNLVALTYCPLAKYKKDYLCIVTEVKDKANASDLPRRLMIYPAKAASDPSLKKVFELNTADSLLAMYPKRGDQLVTLWESGSAMQVNIFAEVDGTIKSVFSTGVRTPPEFADLDHDGTDELLVSRGAFLTSGGRVVSRPETTEIYKWDGKSYTRVAAVRWMERFDALKKAKKDTRAR